MRFIVLFCMLCLCGLSSVSGQEAEKTEKPRAFVLPLEIALPVVAAQPDCPLKFENVKIIHILGESTTESFELRNTGTRPIRDFTVAVYSSYNRWWKSRPRGELNNLIPPGALAPFSAEGVEIIPLTDEMRNKFKLREIQKEDGVTPVIFMVVRVEFDDGGVFDNESAFQALKQYYENLPNLPMPKRKAQTKLQ